MNRKLFIPSLIACLTFCACTPNPVGGEIKNTYWNLSSIKQGGKITDLKSSDSSISAIFSDNKVSGISTCNRYTGDFSVDETILNITAIAATERMCDAINLENAYLGLLSKTDAYSALEKELILFAGNGQLRFEQMSEADVADIKYAEGVGKLAARFQPMDNDEVPHFFPIVRVDRPGNYPYTGQMIDPSLYQFFDETTSEIWNNTGGDVLAVGKFGDFFVCRVPGRYVSSDIALFKLDKGVMKRNETVAWAWCDEGWCNQQDAWLVDLDKDGLVDIVQHYTLTDDKGKIQEERMNVLIQNENGTFKASDDYTLDKENYKMANI